MQLMMMVAAQRYRKLVTDLASEGSGLSELQMMRIARRAPAYQARLDMGGWRTLRERETFPDFCGFRPMVANQNFRTNMAPEPEWSACHSIFMVKTHFT